MGPMPASELLRTAPALLLLAAGLIALRRQWAARPGGRPAFTLAGWALIGLGLWAFGRSFGAQVGAAYGLLALSVLAFGVIAAGVQKRPAPERGPRAAALEPQERRTTWTRGIAKAFLAIVLSGTAAIGLGLAYAVAMPLGTHDRIVIGGLLVPVLWGAGMAWTLCDARLLRATIVLLCASALGYGIAFLPKAFA